MSDFAAYCQSPIGLVEILGSESAVISLNFVEEKKENQRSNSILKEAVDQLELYFAGNLAEFDLPIAFAATPFQEQVWRHLLTIPYGRLASYQQVANALEKPNAVRAVGAANGQNPISVIVPCHRVIGSNGHLTGYGGGLWRKEWLLKHEGSLLL